MEQTDVMAALESVLAEKGKISLQGVGQSMGRRFAQADSLVIEDLGSGEARWADVIVFRRDDRWIAHRLVWKFSTRSPYIGLTKGDGLLSCDVPRVEKTMVAGRVSGLYIAGRVLSLETREERIRGRLRAVWGLAATMAWRVAHSIRHMSLARQLGK